MVYVFHKNHICFFNCFKKKQKKQTHCTYIACMVAKTLKQNVRTMLHLAYHACKNLTHTSKARHVKRIQMVVTVLFTIRVFLTFSAGEESNPTKLSREEMWSLKTRTVARKSWIGGLNLRKGNWHSEILIKSSLIYSVSYLNSEGLSLPVPTMAIGLV